MPVGCLTNKVAILFAAVAISALKNLDVIQYDWDFFALN
jgi:hypothetical protein